MSFFSRSAAVPDTRKHKHDRKRTGSSDIGASDRARIPRIDFARGNTARDQISLMVAESILVDPTIDTGALLTKVRASNSPLNISDATLLTSAAILNSIGSKKAGSDILKKSATVTRMYEKFHLDEEAMLNSFVTLVFTLSSSIRKTVEASVISALKIASEETSVVDEEKTVVSTFSTLAKEGQISKGEARAAIGTALNIRTDVPSIAANVTSPRSVAGTIKPTDSVSQLGSRSPSDSPPRIEERHLREFSKRRRSGTEPEFKDIFRTAREPVSVKFKQPWDKSSLGFDPNKDFFNLQEDMINKLNIGSPSNVMNPADRKHNASNPVIDSTPVSPDVFRLADDEESIATWTSQMLRPPKPIPSLVPTETSVTVTQPMHVSTQNQEISLDELLAAFSDTD